MEKNRGSLQCAPEKCWEEYYRIENIGANIQKTSEYRPNNPSRKTNGDDIWDADNADNVDTFQCFAVQFYRIQVVGKRLGSCQYEYGSATHSSIAWTTWRHHKWDKGERTKHFTIKYSLEEERDVLKKQLDQTIKDKD